MKLDRDEAEHDEDGSYLKHLATVIPLRRVSGAFISLARRRVQLRKTRLNTSHLLDAGRNFH